MLFLPSQGVPVILKSNKLIALIAAAAYSITSCVNNMYMCCVMVISLSQAEKRLSGQVD